MTTLAERVVTRVSRRIGRQTSTRRSFLVRTAVVGTALAANPLRYLLKPGTAYASVCGPEADCGSGWTVFCCSVNEGSNTCPPGTIAAGWWKADGSRFCGGGPRYILDCNGLCGSCGCGRGGICAPGCYNCSCRCGTESCDQRRHCCNEFRYGQCHQELACVGPVVCRIATCMPPWEWDPTCTTTSATANRTGLHHAPCLDGSPTGVAAFGAAVDHGEPASALLSPVVGMESTPTGAGYWLVATDGGIFGFGDAPFLGSTGGAPLNRPTVDMAATTSGAGYWLAASDGGIFAFGDAPFLGSTGGTRLNRPIVGMAATPTGNGYWLVADDGGVFCFGDAIFHGSTGGLVLTRPIVGIAPTPTGNGYWLAASDGGIFAFGDARFHGSLGGQRLSSRITAVAATPTGGGYWLAAEDGGVFALGDATFFGSLGADGSARGRAVDLESRPAGDGYWLATS
ncbi:MAG: hypothetical protein ACT4OX_16015 [Actinomycetota bacterium]